MSKVKFASNQEFEYISNWKILQKAFKAAGVDKVSWSVDNFSSLILILDFNMALVFRQLHDSIYMLYKTGWTELM